MFRIAPSIMCANLLDLESQVKMLEHAGADLLHVDVMDGHFVPNLGLNFDLLRQLRQFSQLKLDVHLMVDSPVDYLRQIGQLSVDLVSFHIEASSSPLRIVRAFKASGARIGIALNPSTPPQAIQYILEEVDYVLVMTVEPGFAGQKFIPAMYRKLRLLRQMINDVRPDVEIQVDGNLDVEASVNCIRCGATILVAGTSSVFRSNEDVYSSFKRFQEQILEGLRDEREAGLENSVNEERL